MMERVHDHAPAQHNVIDTILVKTLGGRRRVQRGEALVRLEYYSPAVDNLGHDQFSHFVP